MPATKRIVPVAIAAAVVVVGSAILQPRALAAHILGPVGGGWAEYNPSKNLQIQSKGKITSFPSSTTKASGPGGSYDRSGGSRPSGCSTTEATAWRSAFRTTTRPGFASSRAS